MNTKLLNVHDVILIGAIAIMIHILVKPLYARIAGASAKSDG